MVHTHTVYAGKHRGIRRAGGAVIYSEPNFIQFSGAGVEATRQFMAAFVASVLGGQPLLISGVTGPITVFNKTIYDIFVKNGSGGEGFDYHQFIGWVYLWGAILHWITAFTNGQCYANFLRSNAEYHLAGIAALRYVTRFPCETFGFYVAWIYIQVSLP
jgi:hypothetical protein